jgi:dipeptidyl aminopeptidase/acylaminoacyl peptidase
MGAHSIRFLMVILLFTGLAGAVQSQDTPTEEATEEPVFAVGNELTVAALREMEIEGSEILVEQTLEPGLNYSQYIASYTSEGNKIYGLLTIPFGDVPEGGFKAIVFNHGFIPPAEYRTTERYVAYVGNLAASGFVVFKIDMRGHGDSEGEPQGSYYSPNYAVDAISALKSLQTMDIIDPEGIGMWGHSMSGNLVLRAMLMEEDVKAGVIWAGAVYSYDDFTRYAISDPSFTPSVSQQFPARRMGQILREAYGPPNTTEPYWQAVSLTEHLEYLDSPVQIHHALNDDVVNVGYSYDLSAALAANGKFYEMYTYEGGGHNISSPYFEQAMQRTILFFKTYL